VIVKRHFTQAPHHKEVEMKTGILAGAVMAGALVVGAAANAAVFVDYVNILGPGKEVVQFISFDETAPEFFVGDITMPTGFIPGTVMLTEPGTGAYSDALSLLPDGAGGVNIFFFSDPLMAPPGDIGTILGTFTETGSVQDVSSSFGTGAVVTVGSDIDMPIPEPATWSLMIIGMAGLGFSLRRRAATAAA
jgi:hypothetical protein